MNSYEIERNGDGQSKRVALPNLGIFTAQVGKLPRIFHTAPQLFVSGNQAWALQPTDGLAYALELGYYQVGGHLSDFIARFSAAKRILYSAVFGCERLRTESLEQDQMFQVLRIEKIPEICERRQPLHQQKGP